MKTHFFIFQIVSILFINNIIFPNSIDSIYRKKVESPYLFIDSSKIYIEKDSIIFNGFLVFRINKFDSSYPCNFTKETIMIESYFINDIKNIEDVKNSFYYIADHMFYQVYVSTDKSDWKLDSTNENTLKYLRFINSKEYKEFKKLYLTNYPFDLKNNSNFLYNPITTDIFYNSSIDFLNKKNNDSIGYFIYKCSFSASILNFYASYEIYNEENKIYIKKELGLIKVLLPISPLYYFKPIEEKEYLKNGFTKANWFPEILKK